MDINPTAASLLGFLHMDAFTGWELQAIVERSVGNFWNVTRSQVYRELKTLATAGLVRPGATGKRDKQPFAITPAGREAFRQWVARPPAGDILRLPMVLSVFFGEHIEPKLLRRYLQQARALHEAQRDAFIAYLPRLKNPYHRATLELGIEYEALQARWAASLPWARDEPAKGSKPSNRKRPAGARKG